MKYGAQKQRYLFFPLGGIGTGSISLRGNGELCDFEIFGRPNKNSKNGYTHFAIKAEGEGGSVTRVLHGDTLENLSGEYKNVGGFNGYGFGVPSETMAGYPHFEDVSFEGDFPIARMSFRDKEFPAKVSLTAFNPMIPQNEYDSSIPAAFFEWEIENVSGGEVRYTLAFSTKNPNGKTTNSKVNRNGARGIFMKHGELSREEIGYTDLTVLTDAEDVAIQEYWYRGGWRDTSTTYWKNLTTLPRLPERSYDTAGVGDHGTVAAYFTLAGGEKKRVRFILAWSTPIQYNYWSPYKDGEGNDVTWKNHYATRFETSLDSASYAMGEFERLLRETELFREAITSSTLPEIAKEAVGANLAVLKSATVLRYEDGSFWAWEGTKEKEGSCEGSCQHVWNYAYALPFLFPSLERSMRENNIKYALSPDGRSAFRIRLPLGRECQSFRACVDGQMGEVIKCYREWKISGDTAWLERHSDAIFKMLEYAWSEDNPDGWDRDRDGVLEGRQHHTLDMELFGPSSWLEGFYLLALDCAAEMADALGYPERAEEYRRIYESGRAYTNENLWNGKYFIQRVDLTDRDTLVRYGAENYWNDEEKQIKYQIGEGCIIDQMLGDWHAALIGRAPIFEKEKKDRALRALYENNFKKSLRGVTNMWRNFALGDEAGALICTYPDGAKIPAIPIPYCEECMTGFEYALAGLMILEGHESEGLDVVRAVRARYDGERRNPWNEIECGSNYARSMASFALMNAYSGFSYDMTRGYIGFSPLKEGEGKFLFSVGECWGTVTLSEGKVHLKLLGGELTLSEFGVSVGGVSNLVTVDTGSVEAECDGRSVRFATPQVIRDHLTVEAR